MRVLWASSGLWSIVQWKAENSNSNLKKLEKKKLALELPEMKLIITGKIDKQQQKQESLGFLWPHAELCW